MWSVILEVLLLATAVPTSAIESKNLPTRIAATVGSANISTQQLAVAEELPLSVVKAEEYRVRRRVLDGLIAEQLLSTEASARKLTISDLLGAEIDARVPAVSEAEAAAVLESNQSRYSRTPRDAALKQISDQLRVQRIDRRRQAFLDELRAKFGVSVNLRPPRITFDRPERHPDGPLSALVTIVEFSDYRCPYCRQMSRQLAALKERYADELRRVVYQLPLPIHPDARIAAEIAECAAEQGAFWRMHEWLFEHQSDQSLEVAVSGVAMRGLDNAKLGECVAAQRQRATCQEDASTAEEHGIATTPTVFVNGRMVIGLQPAGALERIVEEELKWAREEGGASKACP
jgi:predicted DsbA family dithiol-disulfide isomerase